MTRTLAALFIPAALLAGHVVESFGAVIEVGPDSYRGALERAVPGDTILLEPGIYRDGLPIHGLRGEPGNPIVIKSAIPRRAVFYGRTGANTVSIKNSSFVTVSGFLLDGRGLDVDGVKAEGTSRYAHDIEIDGLLIVGHGSDRQIVGVSTKCPAWNWTLRNNEIRGAGTGMYFGQSDGTAPFVGGLIENNLIVDSIGYGLQVKHQIARPAVDDMPSKRAVTVIRDNVIAKASNAAKGSDARPNVLLGHFPDSGPGADDEYEFYGNFLFENATEALLQAEGHIHARNNVFVNYSGDAVVFRPHNGRPGHISFAGNTVVARGTGVSITGADKRFRQHVAWNAVFAMEPFVGGERIANIQGPMVAAKRHLSAPIGAPGSLDFSPMDGQLQPNERGSPATAGVPIPRRDFYARPRTPVAAGAVEQGAPVPWKLGLSVQPSKNWEER